MMAFSIVLTLCGAVTLGVSTGNILLALGATALVFGSNLFFWNLTKTNGGH